MLDHLIGKPSANWQRIQVLLTMLIGYWTITRGKTKSLPAFLRKLNRNGFGRSPWRIVLGSWMVYYLAQNLLLIMGLNAPEPLARRYKNSFYRATWITTALDAGFFTAESLRPHWLRHIMSVVFSLYYLVFANAAEERVRRVQATISIDQIRLSWQKGSDNPILYNLAKLFNPRLSINMVLHIDRPSYRADHPPSEVFVYYAAHPDTFKDQSTVALHFHGGGFVAMSPRSHEDSIMAWAKQTKLPIVSVNYKKAPEYPYPWAVEECFDMYVALVQTRGKIVGLSGDQDLNVIIFGDSAGGNLTAAVTLKILEHNEKVRKQLDGSFTPPDTPQTRQVLFSEILPVPCGLILIYPGLMLGVSCWMPAEQLALIHEESKSSLQKSKSLQSLLDIKDHLSHVSPLSVVPDVEKTQSRRQMPTEHHMAIRERIQVPHSGEQAWEASKLAMTSQMSFFGDRVLTPTVLRATIIMYVGPHAHPDLDSDYFLSPLVAPDHLLAQFPKTYMICGEKDPLVDDTVIFSGRLRQAKLRAQAHSGNVEQVDLDNEIRVTILEGLSHAFLQMMPFLYEARQAVRTVGDWMVELAHAPGGTAGQSSGWMSQQEAAIQTKDHVADIVTTKKDMLIRRKNWLLTGLVPRKT